MEKYVRILRLVQLEEIQYYQQNRMNGIAEKWLLEICRTDYILIWQMRKNKIGLKTLRVVSIEDQYNNESLFSSPHIYLAPHAMKQMDISWGQTISVASFKFGQSKFIHSFALINQTLRHDEIIISNKVARSLDIKNSALQLIMVSPLSTNEQLVSEIAPPDLNIGEAIKIGHKNLSSDHNCFYSRKKNFEMMAFISSEGCLKIQVKVFVKNISPRTVRVYQASDFEGVELTHQQILQCLENPKNHQLFLEMGIIVLRGHQKLGQTYQIQLRQVPQCYSLDTEMIMVKMFQMQNSRKQFIEGSFGQGIKSRSILRVQTDNEISMSQSPNIGGKSAKTSDTKGSYKSNFVFQAGKTEYLKLKKKVESDTSIAKGVQKTYSEQSDIKNLRQKMQKMQDEIKFLKDSCQKTNKKAQKANRKLQIIDQDTNEKLNAIVKEDWLAIENMKKNMEEMYREITESSEFTRNILKRSLIDMDKKLKDISLNCSKFSSSGLAVDKDQREIDQESITIPISPKIDIKSAFVSDYKIKNNLKQQITREGKSQWTQLLTKDILEYSSKTSCSLKIIRSKFNFIMMGIVDRKRIDGRSSWTQDHCLAYCGWNSIIYASGEPVADNALIFKEGGQITMQVEPEKGMISWYLQGIRYTKKSRILKNAEIEWVPYIEMFTPGDMVEWQ